MAASVRIDDEETRPNAVGGVFAPLESAGYPLSVRRPTHRGDIRVPDPPGREEYTAGSVLDVSNQKRPAVPHVLVRAGDPFPIRRPDGLTLISGLVNERPLRRSIWVHQPDVISASTIGLEHNLLAVGRPSGGAVNAWACRQPNLVAAVGIHTIDFPVAIALRYERDLLPIRGPRRGVVAEGVVARVVAA